MIVKLQKTGRSFRGAGAYYLHDKAKAGETLKTTSERVAFTHTLNLQETDPEAAIDEMWYLAANQSEIQKKAGQTRNLGRITNPVQTLSLAWHDNDNPTQEQQIAAAKDFLKSMKWEDHQCLIVGHDETDHRHIHLMINRVHPETGKVMNDSLTYHRADRWAKGYEKNMGKEFTPYDHVGKKSKKERRAEKRARYIQDNESTQQQEQTFFKGEAANENEARDEPSPDPTYQHLKNRQKKERMAFFDKGELKRQFGETIKAANGDVAEQFKPEWRQFYKDKARLEKEGREASGDILKNMMHFAKEGRFGEAWEARNDFNAAEKDIAQQIASMKGDIVSRQGEASRLAVDEACKLLKEQRSADYAALKERQQEERESYFVKSDVTNPHVEDKDNLSPKKAEELTPHTHESDPSIILNDNIADDEGIFAKDSSEGLNKSDKEDVEKEVGAEDGNKGKVGKDGFDLTAGSIGAAIEAVSESLGGLITPPTKKEQARAKFKAIKRDEAQEKAQKHKDELFQAEMRRRAAAIEEQRQLEEERSKEEGYEPDKSKDRD